jgi:hypothetical protein
MMTLPGYGTENIHLGQVSSVLLDSMGNPSRLSQSSDLREYWVYPEKHFEAIVSRRSNKLLSLFFHKGSAVAGGEFFGQSEDRIRRTFGEPNKQGGGLTFADGDYLGRWLSYDSGIGFHFDKSGQVITIAIFAPKRKVRAKKPEASWSHQVVHDLAALRR